MKRLIAAVVVLSLIAIPALAESLDLSSMTMDELGDLRDALIAEIDSRSTNGSNDSEEISDQDSTQAMDTVNRSLDLSAYTLLEKGSKGEAVKALQERLIELYYLDDKADGQYGKNTQAAVEKFQEAHELEVTGEADPETQATLFSNSAQEATLSISQASLVVGSSATTTWYVDGKEFTLKNKQTKTLDTPWGKYKFDAFGEYEKIGD